MTIATDNRETGLDNQETGWRVPEPQHYPSKPAPTGPTLKAQLATIGYRIRWNTRGQHYEYTEHRHPAEKRWPEPEDVFGWRRLDGRAEGRMRSRISQVYSYGTARISEKPLIWSVDHWQVMLADATVEEVDPFLLWLESLPQWDGTERLEHLFSLAGLIHEKEETELVRWAAQSVPLAVIVRAYQPGEPHDQVVTLIGEQGAGKSRFYAHHLPLRPGSDQSPSGWYTASAHFHVRNGDHRQQLESTTGRVLAEFAELSGVYKSEIEAVKNFITLTEDTARLAYNRNVTHAPRRWVGVATTNHRSPLPNDPTGNRRWVPVVITRNNPQQVAEFWAENREQVWAEALWRYHNGFPRHLPDHLQPEQAAAVEEHRSTDDCLEDLISDFLTQEYVRWHETETPETQKHVRFSDFMEWANGRSVNGGLSVTEKHSTRFGMDMRRRSWQKKHRRVNGEPRPAWVPPAGGGDPVDPTV